MATETDGPAVSPNPDIAALASITREQGRHIDVLAKSIDHLATAVEHRPTRTQTTSLVLRVSIPLAVLTLFFVGIMFRDLRQVSDSNRGTLVALEASQRDLDVLVAFVEGIQAQEPDPALARAVEDIAAIKNLLCQDTVLPAEVCIDDTVPPQP